MKAALLYIVSAIVENPDKVNIQEEESGDLIIFKVTVDKADMGKVIGKNGKVIRAIRNVLKISAIKQNKKINIELSENPN
ncbi:MAG: KH domain-containing protein [Patescibacteria group bacterium]|nr:KH domain-containing protein [Patescibacteria group bacterium]